MRIRIALFLFKRTLKFNATGVGLHATIHRFIDFIAIFARIVLNDPLIGPISGILYCQISKQIYHPTLYYLEYRYMIENFRSQ